MFIFNVKNTFVMQHIDANVIVNGSKHSTSQMSNPIKQVTRNRSRDSSTLPCCR